jgi:hypothetical protein
LTDDAADMPTADHPFFWAGFALFDTGRDPRATDEEKPEERVVEVSKPRAPPANPMPEEVAPAPILPPPDDPQPAADPSDDELPPLEPVTPLPDIEASNDEP